MLYVLFGLGPESVIKFDDDDGGNLVSQADYRAKKGRSYVCTTKINLTWCSMEVKKRSLATD